VGKKQTIVRTDVSDVAGKLHSMAMYISPVPLPCGDALHYGISSLHNYVYMKFFFGLLGYVWKPSSTKICCVQLRFCYFAS